MKGGAVVDELKAGQARKLMFPRENKSGRQERRREDKSREAKRDKVIGSKGKEWKANGMEGK